MPKLLEDKVGTKVLFSNFTNVSIQVTRKLTVRYLRRIFIATTARPDAITHIGFAEARKVERTKRQFSGVPQR